MMLEELEYVQKQLQRRGFVEIENISDELQRILTAAGYSEYSVLIDPDTEPKTLSILARAGNSFDETLEILKASEEYKDRFGSNRPDGQFQRDLIKLLNSYSAESPSGTPDFILADLMTHVLREFNEAVGRRSEWRGETLELKPEVASIESDVADDILEKNSRDRDRLIDMIRENLSISPNWNTQLGDVSFHIDPESQESGHHIRFKIIQDVVIRSDSTISEKIQADSPGHLEFVASSRENAEEIKDALHRRLAARNQVTVAQAITLIGVEPEFKDTVWGWTNLDDLRVVLRGEKWILKFPEPIRLDN